MSNQDNKPGAWTVTMQVLGVALVLWAMIASCCATPAQRQRTPDQGGDVEDWTNCLAAGRGDVCGRE